MRKIWKYPVNVGEHKRKTVIALRPNSKLLDIQIQNDEYCAWIEFDPDMDMNDKEFVDFSIYCIYTGRDFDDDDLIHFKTVIEDVDYVVHFYIKRKFKDFLNRDEMMI